MLRKSWISETAYFVICTFLVFDLDFSGLISSTVVSKYYFIVGKILPSINTIEVIVIKCDK